MATFSYDGTQYIGPDVQAIKPNDRFYLVTKNVVDPRADKSLWRLEVKGRGPDFVVTIRSRFDAPDFNQPLRSGMPVMLKGVAFAGNRGAARVEVSFDDGKRWQEARLDYSPSLLTWVVWGYDWQPGRPGEYKPVVRASDGTGAIRTSEERGSAPSGATGYHRATARVEG